jgi:hypothetical protein
MRSLRRYWTSRTIVKRFATPILCAAALLVACDSDREPTSPSGPMAGGGNPAEVTGGLQANLGVVTDVPEWVGFLLNGPIFLQSDGESTKEELPGMGHKFKLFGVFMDDQDPQNPTNDVVSALTTAAFPAGTGSAVRNLPPGIKITALDHQLNLKYYFPSRTCQNGGPRIQLAIDGDGDGKFNQFPGGPDQNAFGYVGHAPFGAGCITGEWDIMDMTDNVGRWDLSQLGGGMTMTWDLAEAFVMTASPNHKVLSGSLVDDGCAGGGFLACGQAYYDLVTVENRTLENDQDTVH